MTPCTRFVAPPLTLTLCLTACGGGDQSADIAASLPETVTNEGDSLTGVSCVKRTETVYRCIGDYKTTEANAVAGYADNNGLSEEEATQIDETLRDMIVAQASSSVTYDVTVARDGTYIAEPSN